MKKSFIYSTIVFFLISQSLFAEALFSNDIKNISFTKNSIGKPEINLTLDKSEFVNVIKKDDLEYVILLPETSCSFKSKPSLEKVSDIIKSVDVKTQPYTGHIKGYTKITIKTNKPLSINAKTNVYKSAQNTETLKQVTKLIQNIETPKTVAKLAQNTEIPKQTIKTAKNIEAPKPIAKPAQNTEILKQSVKPYSKAENPDIVIHPIQKAEVPKQSIKQSKISETKPNIINKVSEKVSKPTSFVNKTLSKDQVIPKLKPEVIPSKTETKISKQNTKQEETFEQKSLIVKEEVKQQNENSKSDVSTTETSKQFDKQQNEKSKVSNSPKTKELGHNKLKSFGTSIFITGILLLLLLFLKLLNRKESNIRLQDVISQNSDDNIELSKESDDEINNISMEQKEINIPQFVPPQEVILPVHESFDHNINETNNIQPQDEEILSEFANKQNEEIEHVSSENTIFEQEQVQPYISEKSENLNENSENTEKQLDIRDYDGIIETQEIPAHEESEIIQDEQYQNISDFKESTEDEEVIQEENVNIDKTIDIEDSFDENFNNEVSPDDVFGIFDEEEINNVNIPLELNTQQESIDNISYVNTNETIITNDFSTYQEPEQEITVETPLAQENNQEENVKENYEENLEEPKEEEETDVVQDSYNFTPTKSIYLVKYDGVSILMASIKDDYFVLKKFDEVIDKPLIVRQTEKNTKKTTYIVRIGSFRGVVEVTLKDLELVLEL